ncbi:MAG: SufD family Fe-S cluster assembly protein [Candidatus Omnitrophica bacterium]|nr:SufD family Fe-S cluster assembly protein [Candidatus Omnitrophota bacterium]MDD5575011.1 SufD family Fe-S cluster assembly protein [Candidatus Omnitrophota bacterium]
MPENRAYLEKDEAENLVRAGFDAAEKDRSGSFMQADDTLLFQKAFHEDIEVMGIDEALRRVPDAPAYYGKAFAALGREYPRETKGGYYIRIKAGKTVLVPVQACLYLKKADFKQKVHNLIIAEPGSKVYIITGCTAHQASREAYHLGISEFFVGKGAYVNFTMIHSWTKDVSVEPKSIALVEDDGVFVSNYICLDPVKHIAMYPTAVLGERSTAHFSSLMVAHDGSTQDIGSRVVLKGRSSSAEIVSRAVSLGGTVIARGHLKAEAPDTKAHLECRGLIVHEQGVIHAIPELETGFREVDMSHEAAIGRISKEEIEYLCARGVSKERAQSLIIRGFVDTNILSLPELLKKEIDRLADQTLTSGF